MIDLDGKYGPLTGRVWGLALNLVANAAALYGAARLLRDGTGMGILITGIAVTALCVAVLAVPSRS